MSETTTIQVAGMTCDGCERSISRALSMVPGVTAVAADHEAGTVEVTTSEPLAREVLGEAIEAAGYDVLPDEPRRLPLL